MEERKKRYERLGLGEIQAIFEMRERRLSYREISQSSKRSVSTIHEVVNGYRHPYPRVWRAMPWYEKAKYVYERMGKNRQRQGRRGRVKSAVARRFIEALLKEDSSPEEIAELMRRSIPEEAVCFKTIYNLIKQERPELKEFLAERGKKRRQRVTARRARKRGAPRKRSIDERPEDVNRRIVAGGLECDLVVSGKGGSGALLVAVCRMTRRVWARKVPNLCAFTILGVLRAILLELPKHMRSSITFDNGAEFGASEMNKLESFFPGLKVYYCDPYCAWQRGSVENANKRIRRYFPKGTDFAVVTSAEVARCEERLNNRLMKCLGWQRPRDVWQSYLKPEQLLPLAA